VYGRKQMLLVPRTIGETRKDTINDTLPIKTARGYGTVAYF